MRNLARAPKFDQYHGEDKFVFQGVVYEHRDFLGKGTTAFVHRFHPVSSLSSAQSVAVKVELPVKCRGMNRFEEGVSFSIEAHWNNEIYGLGVLSGDPYNVMREHYLLMPYFAGVLARDVSLRDARELVEWFVMVACFIHEKMHVEKHAVHGDIKLDNVIFHASEKKACVIDFGLTEEIGKKIGRYSVPESVYPIRGAIKLSPAEYCPQTPPELFGKEMIAAEPSQDVYGLGHFISSLLSKATNISSEQMTKLCLVIGHLRAERPQNRWSIPLAISKLYTDFIAVVPHTITSSVEQALRRVALFHQRRFAIHQDVSRSVVLESVSLPLLTKVMADRQFRLPEHQVGSCDEHRDSGVRLPPAPGALAAPAASSGAESSGSQGQQTGRAPIEEVISHPPL